ncbi:NAD(P)-dependent oxidoreductase [Pseudooceanicola sp.]|uniref:NAD(P)-dependent oxidoreductase n=1 Tax=Pseudooceanicola sp. TaxID=1914328 RepID=UPI002616B815|nr:NAD(P)-dependent oxidoreductase [Pseudooceanicola sp.]MDF1854031.1 NAD(P)-dependent oxidoreductase [Pseudooceanicola sp.]
MSNSPTTPGLAAGRLAPAVLAENFTDLHPALDRHEAQVAADRCYFCHDAPCMTACPTSIDIPLFIRQIATGTAEAAARTIFDQNILGGICARVCPTETLCEEACVRMEAEGAPVEIGRLQRHATDRLMARNDHPYQRAAETGKRVAVVGAGPAGLACAHRLAMKGHQVVIYDSHPKPGGLNEYGIAAYKSTEDFAQAEVNWLLGIGGITVETGRALGSDLTLAGLQQEYDALFLAIGLAGVNALSVPGDDLATDAVSFISDLRQASDLDNLPVGRHVVVIGGGMTAVDAAVQSRLLGAENVTLAYRRGPEQMAASQFERDLAASNGVRILTNVRPVALHGDAGLREVELEHTSTADGTLRGTGETFRLPVDQLFSAIGQTLQGAPEGLEIDGGKIRVDATGRSTLPGIWAGGDCASGGEDLTVTAVAEGRDAAEDIHRALIHDSEGNLLLLQTTGGRSDG